MNEVLVISHNPTAVKQHLESKYTLKLFNVKELDEYLGAHVRRHTLPEGREIWAMSSNLYVEWAIANVEQELARSNQTFHPKVSTPMSTGYRPKLDQSPELDAYRVNYYQGLIGVLQWIIELGQINIMIAVLMLSRYLANPRVGHLEEAIRIFAYLKYHGRSAVVFDHTTPKFDETRLAYCDWSEFYPGVRVETPPNAPELQGKEVHMTCFVNADHVRCQETRRSHTGIIIYVQRTPVVWYSKRQNAVKSSTFGSKFIAMKTIVEQVEALQ